MVSIERPTADALAGRMKRSRIAKRKSRGSLMGGRVMNFVGRANFANNESAQKLEGGDRQLVPRGSDHADQVDDNVKLTTNDLESLTRRMSLTSTREIDSLIGELKTLRQKLATDGSRLESRLAEYAGLSQSVVKLTKIESSNSSGKGAILAERVLQILSINFTNCDFRPHRVPVQLSGRYRAGPT